MQSVEVFIGASALTKAELVEEIAPLLQIDFKFLPDETDSYFDKYVFRTQEIGGYLTDALGFDDEETEEEDNIFLRFQYYIGIYYFRPKTREEHERLTQIRDNFARSIFEKLKATGRYSLLFLFDMQIKLDEYYLPGVPPLGPKAL